MHENSFIPLLVVVAAALATAAIFPRLPWVRVPLVVGEIIIGIILGKSGFQIIPEQADPWLELLSLFGFAFLMFLSGLEIDLRGLTLAPEGGQSPEEGSRRLRSLLWRTLAVFGATLVVSTALSEGLVLMGYVQSPYILALIMSTTSVGLVMPLLKERGEGGTPYGQALILGAVVADFCTMVLITVVVAFYDHGELTMDALVVGTVFVLFFAAFWFGRWLLRRQSSMVRRLAFTAPKTAELRVRASLTIMLLFVVFSQMIGTEFILGAFLAGALISALREPGAHGLLSVKLDAIGFGIFIPIFFIMVGARFDIRSLISDAASLALVPMLLLFAFTVKVVPSLLMTPFFGRRNAIAGGFLLSSRLSLIIAASAIGLRLGVISEAINSAIILVAIVSCIVSPAVYSHLRGQAEGQPSPDAPGDDKVRVHAPEEKLRSPATGETSRIPDLQLVEARAEMFPFLVDRTLAEAGLRARTGLTLLEVVRADGTVVEHPAADFRVVATDSLLLVGTEQQVQNMEALGVSGSASSA